MDKIEVVLKGVSKKIILEGDYDTIVKGITEYKWIGDETHCIRTDLIEYFRRVK